MICTRFKPCRLAIVSVTLGIWQYNWKLIYSALPYRVNMNLGIISMELPSTPRRGICKGFIIILLAILIYAYLSYGTLSVSGDPYFSLRLVFFLPFNMAITGVFLWRGIKALVVKKIQHVSVLNISLWAILFVILVSYVASMILI